MMGGWRVVGTVIAACALGAAPSLAQAPPASPPAPQRAAPQAAVVPESITVGDVFQAAIRVELAEGEQLIVPDTLVLPADLEPAGRRELRIDSVDGTRRATIVYPLAAWRPGEYELPPVTVVVAAGGRQSGQAVRFPSFAVQSVLPSDTTDIEARAAKDVFGANRLWWPILLALLLALAVAAAIYWWWRRRRKDAPAVVVPGVPPRAEALQALAELQAAGLLERGEVRLFYERLTGVLRHYAAAVNAGWSADLTTSELAARLRADLPAPEALELVRILGAADLVKFARARLPAAVASNDLDAGRAWVENVGLPEPEPVLDEGRRVA